MESQSIIKVATLGPKAPYWKGTARLNSIRRENYALACSHRTNRRIIMNLSIKKPMKVIKIDIKDTKIFIGTSR